MVPSNRDWAATTHDWSADVDEAHIDHVRRHAAVLAQGGIFHLILEVLAYANDEAMAYARRGTAIVTWHPDDSISIADGGRGTDTRPDKAGRAVRKPVMSSKDLRFFDADPAAELLPDGHPRRGISVVCALSSWLIHTNRRVSGAWTQRYETGLPVTDLIPTPPTTETGTTVQFLADPSLVHPSWIKPDELRGFARFPNLDIELAGC